MSAIFHVISGTTWKSNFTKLIMETGSKACKPSKNLDYLYQSLDFAIIE
jgi:hypothetical protein